MKSLIWRGKGAGGRERERSRGFYFSCRLWACSAREENGTTFFFFSFLYKVGNQLKTVYRCRYRTSNTETKLIPSNLNTTTWESFTDWIISRKFHFIFSQKVMSVICLRQQGIFLDICAEPSVFGELHDMIRISNLVRNAPHHYCWLFIIYFCLCILERYMWAKRVLGKIKQLKILTL